MPEGLFFSFISQLKEKGKKKGIFLSLNLVLQFPSIISRPSETVQVSTLVHTCSIWMFKTPYSLLYSSTSSPLHLLLLCFVMLLMTYILF